MITANEEHLLPIPPGLLDKTDMRVQEMIHGHRFIPEQEPFMIVLETLSICTGIPIGTFTATENLHESIEYELKHRKKMRHLVFQDNALERIAADERIADEEKWRSWKSHAEKAYGHVGAFDYLDVVFGSQIEKLLQAVRVLRSMEVDPDNSRRWTSRFLAVTGPDLICNDLKEDASGSWSPDRRFFGRGGELVYLMLNRSKHAPEVRAKVDARLLNPDDPVNRVAKALCDPSETFSSRTKLGYLPYLMQPSYDRMAQDWLGVLGTERLPNGHLFEPLFRITALNLLVYLSEREASETGDPAREPIVLDMTDGRDKQLLQCCRAHLNRHRAAANRAVQSYVDRCLSENVHWIHGVKKGDSGSIRKAFEECFDYIINYPTIGDPSKVKREFVDNAISRDKNNAFTYILPLTKNSGLVAARRRVGTWFAASDAMIFAMVLSNVAGTVELRDFVSRLHDRYGIVIGPEEARKEFERPPVGVASFERNLAALEHRMTRMSLTQRLSDDCAFVTNPYRQAPHAS
ncbi:hypothetical protein [Jiella sp. M17.18]|uniref:hypothetical protein n=1 Tax=Jiella sp. M17.18 TaxID=3234247 RepID=UPI0034DF91D9